MTISRLFISSWDRLFKNKKSFLIILFFQALPTVIFILGWICVIAFAKYGLPLFGVNVWDLSWLARFTTPLWLSSIAIVWLLLLLVWLTFQLICSYLSALALSWNYQNKKYTLNTLLRSWNGMWSWAGTGLAVAVQFLSIFILGALLILWFAYIQDYLALIPAIWVVVIFVFFAISLCFSFPVYFFEWKKYFQATKASWQLVRGRWWKTFGYAIVIMVFAIFISVVFAFIEMSGTWGVQFLPSSLADSRIFGVVLWAAIFLYYIVQMFVNIVVQVFIQSVTFSLYHDYQSITNTRIPKKNK